MFFIETIELVLLVRLFGGYLIVVCLAILEASLGITGTGLKGCI
jgi:hypothetical protein